MIKRITPIGNSQGVIIDKTVLKLLGADEATHLDLSIENGAIVLRPVDEKGRRQKFASTAKRVLRKHGDLLRRLAKS